MEIVFREGGEASQALKPAQAMWESVRALLPPDIWRAISGRDSTAL